MIEKIKAEIERLKDARAFSDDNNQLAYWDGLNKALRFIESLEQEQPQGLDEAAEDFGKRQGSELYPFAKKFFKAGAKWTEEQFDLEADGEITQRPDGTLGVCIYIDERSGYKFGDKVIVQISKKEE